MAKTNMTLKKSWSSFDQDTARMYLKGFGRGSETSKQILAEVLNERRKNAKTFLLELGCGNGQLYETLKENNVECSYTGVDFSPILLKAAKQVYKHDENVEFVLDDVMNLKNIVGTYDYGIYSHVIEMLSSPELSLLSARKFCRSIIIRFFEPPDFEHDSIELLEMNVGKNKTVPYIRRKMSKDYYRLMLHKIGCKKVDIYRAPDKDQVHLLHF